MKPRLIVHGGAWDIPDKFVDDHIKGVHRAVEEIYPLLEDGMSALDAVEKAVNILELDPTFDAGRGAFLNARGDIELDALIMDGKELDFGAVCAVANLMHPVSLARKVMGAKDFRILAGAGAMEFAKTCGFEELDPRELMTERELDFYEKIKNDEQFTPIDAFSGQGPSDTVGAVAMDKDGNLACATSTGGTPRKHPGRIGDSPIIGSGGYADNCLGAASATGYGESLLRVMLCRTACDFLRHEAPMQAADNSICVLKNRGQGYGGIILIDHFGDYGIAHNTPRMAFAYADDNGNINAHIRLEEDVNTRPCKDYKDFCAKIHLLLKDPSFPIENIKTVDFLEAMNAWLISTKGGSSFDFDTDSPESITWEDLTQLIHAASMYE
ncbi:isoaspartyl peptidase/L-asparaginase [Pseudodesulfovibrio sp. zrk46]|uniref:isoaspartyl peptidase/L-asparaginase n=1 Tax=Pseudodesulfovibrio sp. zrk46 TaxID=2725288 RepID=UPI001B39333E|nr:isoaspartyl peptidase/L-asparaginase [Pseudodesulfovibrio sp. zrk46]